MKVNIDLLSAGDILVEKDGYSLYLIRSINKQNQTASVAVFMANNEGKICFDKHERISLKSEFEDVFSISKKVGA